jgi:hypothetical protein
MCLPLIGLLSMSKQ